MDHPEDSRISQLLRQLKRMVINKQDQSAINELFERLQQRVWDQANKGYINRSFDTIADDVLLLLLEAPKRLHPQVVHTFACIGFVLHASSFHKYFGFIVRCYKQAEEEEAKLEKWIRLPLMDSLRQTIKMNCKLPADVVQKVIRTLKEILENVDADLFVCISDTLDELVQAHPTAFKRYFKDVVDIIIGWHLEVDRSGELKLHCSRVLQNFGLLWTRELEFSQDLVVHFKEDIEASEAEPMDKTQFGCYVGALNTIVKCLQLSGDFCLDTNFLVDCFNAILSSISNVLEVAEFPRGFDIVENVNEFMAIAMDSRLCDEAFTERVLGLVRLQMDSIHTFSDEQCGSLICLVTKMIPFFVTKDPEFIQGLFFARPAILQKRMTRNKKLRLLLIDLFQNVLHLKNVQILKHIYTEIVTDLGRAMTCLAHPQRHTEEYTREQAQLVIVFNLNCLTKLAMDNTSIIALYACQPSLLEVFVNVLQPLAVDVWSGLPEMHSMIVHMMFMHAKQNKNFTMSSNLLRGTTRHAMDYSKQSPTSEHFEIILELLVGLLERESPSLTLVSATVFEWILELMVDARGNDQFYAADRNWKAMAERVIELSQRDGHGFNPEMIIKTGKCLDHISQLPTLARDYAEELAGICCLRIDSTNPEISELFCRILAALPLNVTLTQSLAHLSTRSHVDALWRSIVYGNRSESDIWPAHFEQLFKALSMDTNKSPAINEDAICDVIWECFNKCHLSEDGQFVELAQSNSSLLIGWMQWELAKFCVNNKLKTPLGKAQDTFLHIEGLVRKIARIVDGKEVQARFMWTAKEVAANQVKSRVVLGFVEALEKCIYNAAEGTAYSCAVLEKPIKAFFRLNAPTCSEWFKRNRIPIEVVGGEMMDSDLVVRNAEASLKAITGGGGGDCKVEQVPLLEHNLVALVRAYLRLGDSHSILGVMEWTRRKYLWIKTAADQAENKFEVAAQSYSVLLVTEEMSKVIKEFVAEQLFVCLCATGNFEDLTPFMHVAEYKELIKRIVPQFMEPQQSSEGLFPSVSPVECPSTAINRMANWDQVNNSRELIPFSMRSSVTKLQSNLIVATNTLKLDVNTTRDSLNVLTREAFRTQSQELLPEVLMLQHVFGKIKEKQLGRSVEISSFALDKSFGSKYLHKVLNWAQMLKYEELNGCDVIAQLQMDLISVARKERNYSLAGRQLEQFFTAHLPILNERMELENLPRLLIENEFAEDLWTEDLVRASFEASKLLYCSAESRDKAIKLLSHINLVLGRGEGELGKSAAASDQLRARMLLKIADGIGQKEDDVLNNNKDGPVQELLLSLDEFTSIAHFNSESVVSPSEISIGKLLAHTVKLCPTFSKSWCIYGNWCYKWGRKIIELSHSKKHKNSLQYDYNTEIRRIVPHVKAVDIQTIINLLDDLLLLTDNDNDDIGPNDSSDSEKVAVATLKALPCLTNVSTEKVMEVIGVWHRAHRHVYGCYEMAAGAYFKFLQMDNAAEENLHQHTVIVTLRLLRLIVKHALSLQDVLEEGLATTPTGPWKTIIPQLFSRLNHHELYVRRRVSELLCRVAKDAPHIIIFPAVVGCGQGRAGDLSNVLLVAPSLDKADGGDNRELLVCFQALVTTLSRQASDTVAQVQVLVRELQRIGLLWDELWLVGLTRVFGEFNKKMQVMEGSSTSTDNKKDVSAGDKATFQGTMVQFKATLLATIEKLDGITGGVPETRNEMVFQAKYKKHIEALRDAARQRGPEKTTAASLKIWNQFKSFYSILHQRSNRRSSSALKMEDISPVLFNLHETVISMPGVATEGEQIYIRSVTNAVQILPTKTRPKKFAFIGDDNRQYTYLFKGLEDLHLDERIMQFLSISNTIMRKASQKTGVDYRARHYSVIPLGTQSGIINWVDGVVPIFSLYKRWQQRELAKAKKEKETQAAVMRPSELFYSKVTPLLAEHKLDVNENRRNWPVAVLRQVLEELSRETPKDLLAKEFWCNSTTTAGWRKTVKNYSLSVAVMSVIGYVIGLGDRHLDNVLVDVASGEILHIDYNVCFEKGKTLRVPEKIPFRMTQNFQEALGLTGIEGTFRMTCETVLRSLKKGRETLLTLLEAFVYDPLVDWTVEEAAGGETTTTTTKAIKQSSRDGKVHAQPGKSNADNLQYNSNSLKQQWKTIRDEIQKSNFALEECQRSMSAKLQQKQRTNDELMDVRRQLEMVSLYSLEQIQILAMKYDTYHALQSAVQSKYDWSERVIRMHDEYFMARFDDSDLVHFIGRLPAIRANAVVFEFETIQSIFVAANHLELLAKSRDLALEMTTAVVNVSQTLQTVYELFVKYSAVLSRLPEANSGNHFIHQFRVWCDSLLNGFRAFDLSVPQCQMVLNEIGYGGAVAAVNSVAVTSYASGLLTNIQDLSIQHQMLSMDCTDMGDLQERYCKAREVMMDVRGENGEEEHVRRVQHLNYTVLWELQKKYKQILNSTDLSKLRYETALNSNLFCKHAQVMREVRGGGGGEEQLIENSSFKLGLEALEKCTDIYEWMCEIQCKFSEDLIPWSVQAIFTGDRHVIEMITKVSQCYAGGELKELERSLVESLEESLVGSAAASSSAAAGGRPGKGSGSAAVNEIKYQLAELYKSYANEKHVGAKIFKRFYELFNTLEQKFKDMADSLTSHGNQVETAGLAVENGEQQQQQEQERDNKLVMALLRNRHVLEIVKQLYVVKKVDALIEFFVTAMNNLRAFQGSNGSPTDATATTLYNDQTLFAPFKLYLNDFLYNILFGIGGHCQSLVLRGLVQELDKDRRFATAAEQFVGHCEREFVLGNDDKLVNMCLLRDLTVYWERACKNAYVQKMVQGQEREIQRLHMMLKVHEWVHEDVYQANNIRPEGLTRSQFVVLLRPLLDQLIGWQATITKLRQESGVLGDQIKHDLQWADTRYKPLIASYETQTALKERALNTLQTCCWSTMEILEQVIHYEALRKTSPESYELSKQLVELLEQIMIMCSQGVGLERAEAKIVEMGPSPLNGHLEVVTEQWREEIVRKMRMRMEELRGREEEVEEEARSIEATIRQETTQLLKLVPGLQTILGEVQNLTNPRGEKDCLLSKYTRCMDVVHSGLNEIARGKQQLDRDKSLETIRNFNAIISHLKKTMVELKLDDELEVGRVRSRAGAGAAGEVQPKQNSYAVTVWRRVRMKLEGRDPDASKRMSVEDQVDWMIREATNVDNLAVLYEGWTPWV